MNDSKKREMWVIEYKKKHISYSLKIEELIEFCKNIEIEEVKLEDVIIPLVTEEDKERIESSNLENPIILLKTPLPILKKSLIHLDGAHRIRKAYLRRDKTIKATILKLEDSRIPEEWRELFKLKIREWSVRATLYRFYNIIKTHN